MLCACDKMTDMQPKDCTFVSDGRPCCSATCYHNAEARRVERQMRARSDLRRVPHFDDGSFDVVASHRPNRRYSDI